MLRSHEDFAWTRQTLLPSYIVGQRLGPDGPGMRTAELLLLPASGIRERRQDSYYPFYIVRVRKDDLDARDELVAPLLGADFTDPEAMVNRKNGSFIVNSGAEGSIRLASGYRGSASPHRVATKGLRFYPDKTKRLRDGVDDETLESFEVDRTVAILVAAFEQTDNVRSLLSEGVPMALTRELQLLKQNRELKTRLGQIMVTAGMKKHLARELIEQEFPTI
jgi:hypothetical protein